MHSVSYQNGFHLIDHMVFMTDQCDSYSYAWLVTKSTICHKRLISEFYLLAISITQFCPVICCRIKHDSVALAIYSRCAVLEF